MITVYTDGCYKKDDSGGVASIILKEDGSVIVKGGFELSIGSSNRAEIKAAFLGLLETKKGDDVTLVSDSKYLVEGISFMEKWKEQGWRIKNGSPAKNSILWKLMIEIKNDRNLNPIWVKGHDETTFNILCDRIANFCCSFRQEININFESISQLLAANESYLRPEYPRPV